MFDSVVIGNKDSFYDYEASMKEREIGDPKKKSIKETVPFSNAIYDFSKIDGEIYWDERVLTYVFEITADSPEELEEKKQKFKAWIMNVHEEDLYDPYIEYYHFVATFDDISCDDSEIEKSTITVTFTAYPYMVANQKTSHKALIKRLSFTRIQIENNSSHRIVPIFRSDNPFIVTINHDSHNLQAGETSDSSIVLEVGSNEVDFMGDHSVDGEYYVEIEFCEEVF